MNVACDYEAPMQMLTTEKYIASRPTKILMPLWVSQTIRFRMLVLFFNKKCW